MSAAIFTAGVFEQGGNGWDRVTWSKHNTPEAARKAATKYARDLKRSGPQTGGLMTWAAWYKVNTAQYQAVECVDGKHVANLEVEVE
jgi:hypothetical protein